MVAPGRRREVRGHRRKLRSLQREDPVELREADVVTDGEADRPPFRARHDGLRAGLLGLRLAIHVAPHLDVEEMDLAVHRDELAFGVEDAARVRELLTALAPFGDRAADERHAERLRPACHRAHGLAALERLRCGAIVVGAPDQVPLLGQDDDVGAGRRGARDERLCARDVRRLVLAARHLHAGDTDPVGHDLRIVRSPEQILRDAKTIAVVDVFPPAGVSAPRSRPTRRRPGRPRSGSSSGVPTRREAPAHRPRDAGMDYVEDACTAVVHRRL